MKSAMTEFSEWLKAYEYELPLELQIKAKECLELEKKQHGITWDKSMENLDARGGNTIRAWCDFDEYYNETYGNKQQANTSFSITESNGTSTTFMCMGFMANPLNTYDQKCVRCGKVKNNHNEITNL